jgi:hypothetical protein
MDIPRISTITESAHRIHNPLASEKLAALGAALRLEPETRAFDLGRGSGEMLCTWARDCGISGSGIDMSRLFTEQARLRAKELGVANRVEFIHGDAAGYVAEMVLAGPDSRDRFEAAQRLALRRWLEANPGDAPEKRGSGPADLSKPGRYADHTREYLGWGVFALMPR